MIARARALVIARRALTSHEADWACDQSARGGCEVAVIVSLPLASDIQLALDRLKSLHDGDIGVLEIVACGRRAIPALRALLLEGESSGIYHPRCRAVEALSALGAHDVLIEFLGSPREMADPVNRTGEEVVISAAARALTNSSDERRAGEIALLQMGSRARAALLRAASRPTPSAEWETQTSRRARRSAVQLLALIGVQLRQRCRLRVLMEDADAEVSVHACRAYLAWAPEAEKPEALRRLVELLPRLGWMQCEEVEQCILEHFESARAIIGECMRDQPPEPTDGSQEARICRSLFSVVQRAGSASH